MVAPVDADRIYSELQALAVTQGKIVTQQAADSQANASEHAIVTQHLARSNGDMAELRKDFDEKAVEDARRAGQFQGALNAIGVIMGITATLIAAGGTITGIAVAITKWGG